MVIIPAPDHEPIQNTRTAETGPPTPTNERNPVNFQPRPPLSEAKDRVGEGCVNRVGNGGGRVGGLRQEL